MEIGDELLVYGPGHFEKVTIIAKEGKVYTLSNKIKMSRHLEPINSKFTIERFSQERYDYFKAYSGLSNNLRILGNSVKILGNLPMKKQLKFLSKLKKLVKILDDN